MTRLLGRMLLRAVGPELKSIEHKLDQIIEFQTREGEVLMTSMDEVNQKLAALAASNVAMSDSLTKLEDEQRVAGDVLKELAAKAENPEQKAALEAAAKGLDDAMASVNSNKSRVDADHDSLKASVDAVSASGGGATP